MMYMHFSLTLATIGLSKAMANSLISVIRLKLDDPTVNNTTEIEAKQAIYAATKVKKSFCNDGIGVLTQQVW